jgi:predicted RNase H-like nuclease
MQSPKKIKNKVNPVGMAERKALLVRCGYGPDFSTVLLHPAPNPTMSSMPPA